MIFPISDIERLTRFVQLFSRCDSCDLAYQRGSAMTFHLFFETVTVVLSLDFEKLNTRTFINRCVAAHNDAQHYADEQFVVHS